MSKVITFSDEARTKISAGISKAAKVVGSTLGPRGLNVILDKDFDTNIVNDGITVLKDIELEDKLENLGVKLVKQAASKTNDLAGDGTSSTTVLTDEILKRGIKYISAGANGVYVKRGIDKAVKEVVNTLKDNSIPVDNNSRIKDIATISANSKEIGDIIADAIDKVGKDGVVSLDDSKTNETYVKVVGGLLFKKGMASPYFATDPVKGEVVFENPTIIVCGDNISTLQESIDILDKAMPLGKPVVIIAKEISQEVLTMLVVNKLRGVLEVAVVKAPGFGNDMADQLGDIAAFTGATGISSETGNKIKDVTAEMFGNAKKIIITKDDTTIIEGAGNPDVINSRYSALKAKFDEATSEYDKARIEERMAKLKGAIAVVHVGGNTESEQKELRLRVEDALNSTKAAISEGIVAGGGCALVHAAKKLNATEFDNEDERTGYNIIKESLNAPCKQILANSGFNSELKLAQLILTDTTEFSDARPVDFGYNASNGDFCDLVEKGIIDPVKVVRSAIVNAASVAGMILTANTAITDKPEEKDCGCKH